LRRRSFLALGLLPAAACTGASSDTYEWRQKLTVTLDTPQGVTTGSSVTAICVELTNARSNRIARIMGEATVVEVGRGQYLFALLSGQLHYKNSDQYTDELVELVWQDVLPPRRHQRVGEQNFDGRKEWGPRYRAIAELQGARDMTVALWPTFVMFTDLNDPSSVKVLAPHAFKEAFGHGIAVRAVSLELTRDAATDGAAGAVLPWLAKWDDMLIPVARKADDAYTPEQRIRHTNFKQGR
jgi:hypothetical protein